MIKLIASDMDGSLLDTNMHISQENIEAIHTAQAKGIEFMVATGRARSEALPPLEKAGIKCAMITLNGAEIFEKDGQVIFKKAIEKQNIFEILAILEEHDVYCEISTNKGIFSENQPQRIENYATHIVNASPHVTYQVAKAMAEAHLALININYVEKLKETIKDETIEVYKVIGFHIEGEEKLLPTKIAIEKISDIIVTSSAKNNIEINHIEAQKGLALAKFAKLRGLTAANVMAVGDSYNDVSMLRWADISFAMGNANAKVKAKAKYVTHKNTDSGVGEAIIRTIADDL